MTTIPNVVLLVETSREFGRSFMYGIARYSRNHGPWAFYREPGGMNQALPHFQKAEVDGIIMRNPQQYNELVSLNRPTILVIHQESEESDFPRVITCGEKIGYMAAEHFLDKGFREFGFCGLRTVQDGQLRHLAGTPRRGILHWYRDPVPTNCVAAPYCAAAKKRPGRSPTLAISPTR